MQPTTSQPCHRPASVVGTMSLKVIGSGPGTLTTALTEQTINTGATMKLVDPH